MTEQPPAGESWPPPQSAPQAGPPPAPWPPPQGYPAPAGSWPPPVPPQYGPPQYAPPAPWPPPAPQYPPQYGVPAGYAAAVPAVWYPLPPMPTDGPGVAMARHPHAEPQEHHRLLRTPRGRGWMPAVGVVALIGFYLVAAVLALLPFILAAVAQGSEDGFFPEDSPLFLLMNNIGLIVLIPVAFLVVRLVHRERPGFLSSVTGRLRWRLLVPFTLIALGSQFVIYLLVALVPALGGIEAVAEESPTPPEPATIAAFLIVILLTTPLQAAAEEYAFRGYLSQAIGFFTRSWLVPAAITGLLFAAAHGSQDLAAFTDRFAFGFVASYVTWRSGGLEAAIADHAINNVLILGIGSFFGNPLPDTNIQTTLPWPLVGVDILGMAIFAVGVTWYCRRRDLQRRSAVLVAEAPPPPSVPLPA